MQHHGLGTNMKIQTLCTAICLGLVSSLGLVSMGNAVLAQGPVTFTAKYDGGSLKLAHEALQVGITSDQVLLVQEGKQFAIPVSSITFVAYSDPGAKAHLAAIQWSEPAGEMVLAIQRPEYNKAIPVLKNLLEKAALERMKKAK